MLRLPACRTFFLTVICAISLFMTATVVQAQPDLSEGTYTITYNILKPDNDSVSMANDYWEKPATAILENGAWTVQTTINHSAWVASFQVPSGDGYKETKVISSNPEADSRVAQFSVDDLSKPLLAKLHVIVESIDYNHKYSIKLVFDMDSLKLVKASGKAENSKTKEPAAETSGKTSSEAAASTGDKKSEKTDEKAAVSGDKAAAEKSAGQETSQPSKAKPDKAAAATEAPAPVDTTAVQAVESDKAAVEPTQDSNIEIEEEADLKQNEASAAVDPELNAEAPKGEEVSTSVEVIAAPVTADEEDGTSSTTNAILIGSLPLVFVVIGLLIFLWKRKKSNKSTAK